MSRVPRRSPDFPLPAETGAKRIRQAPPEPGLPLYAALRYAGLGWAVLPILPGGKEPLTAHGVRDATSDPDKVKAWWTRWPEANVGIALGQRSGVVVLDVDDPEALRRVVGNGHALPPAPTVRTTRGYHLYFRAPEGRMVRSRRVVEGAELKGEGSYVVAPPSIHPSGQHYEWAGGLSLEDLEPPPLPPWLLEAQEATRREPFELPQELREGERNTTLTRLAGALRAKGCTTEEILEALRALNRSRCRPPLPEEELEQIARSASRWTPGGSEAALTNSLNSSNSFIRTSYPWPTLPPEAFVGLWGELVQAVEPYTEADPVAVLATGLSVFGNLLGPEPHVRVGDTRHGLKIWPMTVGATGRGRKGTALDLVLGLAERAFAEWRAACVAVGLSSGEGLIYAVRDSVERGGKVLDQGAADKRLLVVETEFAGVLRALNREGNTLSAVLRQAWDRDYLRSLVKNAPHRATGAHVTVVGHITAQELLRYLHEAEVFGGLLNRFLVLLVRRSKLLPDPEPLPDQELNGLVLRLRRLVEETRKVGEVRRSREAAELWRQVYPRLTEDRPGLYGGATARAEAQVVRLAALYALSDGQVEVQPAHLRAALALWGYADQSCRYLLGDRTGNPVADRLLQELRAAGRLTRTDAHSAFGRNLPAARLDAALAALEASGLARRVEEGDGGRRRTVWVPADELRIYEKCELHVDGPADGVTPPAQPGPGGTLPPTAPPPAEPTPPREELSEEAYLALERQAIQSESGLLGPQVASEDFDQATLLSGPAARGGFADPEEVATWVG